MRCCGSLTRSLFASRRRLGRSWPRAPSPTVATGRCATTRSRSAKSTWSPPRSSRCWTRRRPTPARCPTAWWCQPASCARCAESRAGGVDCWLRTLKSSTTSRWRGWNHIRTQYHRMAAWRSIMTFHKMAVLAQLDAEHLHAGMECLVQIHPGDPLIQAEYLKDGFRILSVTEWQYRWAFDDLHAVFSRIPSTLPSDSDMARLLQLEAELEQAMHDDHAARERLYEKDEALEASMARGEEPDDEWNELLEARSEASIHEIQVLFDLMQHIRSMSGTVGRVVMRLRNTCVFDD